MFFSKGKEKKKNLPQRNSKTPDGLCLEAIPLRHAGPAVERGEILAEILTHGLGEGVGGGDLDILGLVVDDVAIQVGDGFADGDGDDDEGDQQQRIGGGHDEETDVGDGPEEGNGDEAVQGCDAGLV